MKVNGKERDYYDSALDYSNAEQITWFRKMVIHNICSDRYSKHNSIKKERTIIEKFNKKIGFSRIYESFANSTFFIEEYGFPSTLYITNGFISFAGKIYRYIKLTDQQKNVEVFYDLESLVKKLTAKNCEVVLDHLVYRGYLSGKDQTLKDNIEKFFDKKILTDSNQLHIDLDTPIYIFDQSVNFCFYKDSDFDDDEFKSLRGSYDYGIVSGRLSDYQFVKIMLPNELVQELEMFMGNVLVKRDPVPIMTDNIKIASHGFDVKSSFRKSKVKK